MNSCEEIEKYQTLIMGKVSLNEREKSLYKTLNGEIIELCGSLPEPVKSEALITLMSYGNISPGEDFDFFKNYYSALWTVVHHILISDNSRREVEEEVIKAAVRAHAMSMLLHSLDDHLHDGELPSSHILLLVRTASWMRMIEGIDILTGGSGGGNAAKERYINDYYDGLCNHAAPETLDQYCSLFVRQMGIWLIIPSILSLKLSDDPAFSEGITCSLGHFGSAWRIIDDVNDIESDVDQGTRSAVYVALNAFGKRLWEETGSTDDAGKKEEIKSRLFDTILGENIPEILISEACSEMNRAAEMAENHGLPGLAEQYHQHTIPLIAGIE